MIFDIQFKANVIQKDEIEEEKIIIELHNNWRATNKH
jgi:hypothetical protein